MSGTVSHNWNNSLLVSLGNFITDTVSLPQRPITMETFLSLLRSARIEVVHRGYLYPIDQFRVSLSFKECNDALETIKEVSIEGSEHTEIKAIKFLNISFGR